MSDVLIAASELLATGGAVTLGAWALHRPSPRLTWRELQFPGDLAAEPVEALLRHVAGVRQGPVVLLVSASAASVRFLVAGPASAMTSITAAASGLLPEVRFEKLDVKDSGIEDSGGTAAATVRVAWPGPWPLLGDGKPELTAAGLLGALGGATGDERLWLVLRLTASGRVHRPLAASERNRTTITPPWFVRPWWPAEPPGDELWLVRQKFSGPLLRTEMLVIASSKDRSRALQLTRPVVAALRAASGVRGRLRQRPVRGAAPLPAFLARRTAPLLGRLTTLLSPTELSGLIGWPVEAPRIAGVSYGVGPRLLPAAGVPQVGRVFAHSTWPGAGEQPLAQPIGGGLQHTAIVGPTGSGKSALVQQLVAQDLAAGRGALVVDLKGDLVGDLLARIPKHRVADVIVLEPAADRAQPGLQLFPPSGDPELTSDLVLGTLRELFADSFGVRSYQYLGLGLRTLAGMPGSTLVELPWLFTDPAFRARALRSVRDPWLQAAWARFAALSAAEQATHLASPLTKLEQLTGRGRLRLVLGQADSRLDFGKVLQRGRVVLVSLPPGLLGMPATRLLAALTLWQFFQAVEARAALPPSDRRPFMAYIDEVAVLAALPLPLSGLLERARGHGVGLTISPQALSQLSTGLRASLLANVGSLAAFQQTSDEEAKLLAKALPGVTTEQLQYLGPFEIALRLALAPGRVSATMTGRTLAPGDTCSDPAAVRDLAAEGYGAQLTDVDAALAMRHGLVSASGPVASPSAPATAFGKTRRRP